MALSWQRGRPLPLAIRAAVRRPAGCRWRLIRLSRIHSPLEDPCWETKDPDGASRGCRGLCFRFGSACLCAIFDLLGRVTAEICCKRRLSQAVPALVAESRYTQKSHNCNSLLHPPTRTASQNRTDKTFRSKIGMDFGCAPAAPRSLSARNNAFPGKSHCIVHASPVAPYKIVNRKIQWPVQSERTLTCSVQPGSGSSAYRRTWQPCRCLSCMRGCAAGRCQSEHAQTSQPAGARQPVIPYIPEIS